MLPLLKYGQQQGLNISQLSALYVKMIPDLSQKVQDLKLRQQEMYDSLANYQEKDELAHLRFDFSFDDVFIDFLNH